MAAGPPAPVKAWLAEFLLSRGHIGSIGKPLYGYQVTAEEFKRLQDLLFIHRDHADHPLYGGSWAAAFCLFVAERYRREYGADDDGWSWSPFERHIGCNFSQLQRTDLVERGLAYWKRPVRRREGRRDLLGSLCLEGGLPWQLVRSETHGFGRTVRRGLKYFYRTEVGRRTTADLIGDWESDLPLTFRNLDTRQLLAGLVEQLMYLVQKYPLKDQSDPAGYLDKNADDWRSEFPIPLDESNARTLINDWLRDAGKSNQERREALEREQRYTCEHYLIGELTDWSIETRLTIPPEETIEIDVRSLGSTRLSLGFFEGERLLVNAGAVYGQLGESSLRVRHPTVSFKLKRKNISEPVSLRLLESGRPVHIVQIDGSALDIHEVPMAFESRETGRCLVGSASCSLPVDCLHIRVPVGCDVVSGAVQEIARESSGAIWFECREDLLARNGDEIYRILLRKDASTPGSPEIIGRHALFESVPSAIFIGWPQIKLPGGSAYTSDQLVAFANGRRVSATSHKHRAGTIRLSVRTSDGQTLLHRRFGILPDAFGLSLIPATRDEPARMIAKNAKHLQWRVRGDTVRIVMLETAGPDTVMQLHCVGNDPPGRFEVEVSSAEEAEPVTLLLDYPKRGARLIDCDNQPTEAAEILLDELVGKRIALTSSQLAGEVFHVQLDLLNREKLRIRQHYSMRVAGAPVPLSLFGYRNDIQQMLGAVDEQDAYVRLTVETDQRLLSVNVRRYNAVLQRADNSLVSVLDMSGHRPAAATALEAMLLPAPKLEPVDIPERSTQGVGTGDFEIPTAMERDGPWLVYPSRISRVKFRPELYLPRGFSIPFEGDVSSLHQASRVYHPISNPDAISDQVALMAIDLDHSGWQYLDDLRRNFSHLPLSTFQSWLALSGDGDCLAVAVLRMEVDEGFCNRIRDELAVIWECIPIETWVAAFRRFRAWLEMKVLPNVMVENLLGNRKSILKVVVPGFEHLGDFLATGTRPASRMPPLEVLLPIWYQALRRNNESNDHWPMDLGLTLAQWVDQQALPLKVRRLSSIDYSHAVTYLPIFMAHVTAGRMTTSALPGHRSAVKFAIRTISDFDRQGWYLCAHALVVWHLMTS